MKTFSLDGREVFSLSVLITSGGAVLLQLGEKFFSFSLAPSVLITSGGAVLLQLGEIFFFFSCPICLNNFRGSCFIAAGRKIFFFFSCPICLNNFRGSCFIAAGKEKSCPQKEDSLDGFYSIPTIFKSSCGALGLYCAGIWSGKKQPQVASAKSQPAFCAQPESNSLSPTNSTCAGARPVCSQ